MRLEVVADAEDGTLYQLTPRPAMSAGPSVLKRSPADPNGRRSVLIAHPGSELYGSDRARWTQPRFCSNAAGW